MAALLRGQWSLRWMLAGLLAVNIGSCAAHYRLHPPEEPRPITAKTSGYGVAE